VWPAATRTHRALAAWSPRATCACNGTLTSGSTVARRWLDGGKVLPTSTSGVPGGAGQEEWRRGSPRQSGDGGAAGSGRCGGVQRRRGCSGGRRRAWRGPAAPVWKGKERFSSNSGMAKLGGALTGEGKDSGGARQNPTRGRGLR
jgi:hypothetical protein